MAQLPVEANINEIPEREDFSPIAAGTYNAMIVASQMKPTRDNAGEYLELEVEVVEGPFTGRKLFERLNLKNNNQQTVTIAYQTLGEMIKAVRKISIKDSEELHNIRISITVDVEQGKPYYSKTEKNADGSPVQKEGKPQNRIKRYHPAGATQATAGQMAAASASTAGANTGAPLPPWKR